jgi:hypothetical protein
MARNNRVLEKNFENLRVLRTRMFRATVPQRRRCLCVCNCGTKFFAWAHHLLSGNTASCGCKRSTRIGKKAVRYSEGYSTPGHPLSKHYARWSGMMARCYRPKNHAYHRYGGRGVRVCKRWHSFENFLADMGLPPAGFTLDRIDNDGNYEPDNCRWATRKEQSNNTSRNISPEVRGVRSLGRVRLKRLQRLLQQWE